MSARAAFALSLFLATAAHAFQEEVSSLRVAHLASQDVVADKWAAASPDAGSLLCATPSRAGHVNKNPNIRHTPFVTPSAEVVKVSKDLRMPLYAGCQVFVSDEWRFIYVRNPKSSSTALLEAIKEQFCGGECSERQLVERGMMDIFAINWEPYFVFTVVRNPWTRALSAYSMFNDLFLFKDPEGDGKVPTEHCGLPFESYAEDPYRMRELCDAESCCSYVGGVRAPGFVDIHISDQAHCAFLADGQPFVDYIGASENLMQAWQDIVAGVNNNAGSVFEARDPENPNGTGNTTAGGVAHTCTSEVVLQRYTAAALYGVASHYALDVVRFGYI